jgi:hypothetical protein
MQNTLTIPPGKPSNPLLIGDRYEQTFLQRWKMVNKHMRSQRRDSWSRDPHDNGTWV